MKNLSMAGNAVGSETRVTFVFVGWQHQIPSNGRNLPRMKTMCRPLFSVKCDVSEIIDSWNDPIGGGKIRKCAPMIACSSVQRGVCRICIPKYSIERACDDLHKSRKNDNLFPRFTHEVMCDSSRPLLDPGWNFNCKTSGLGSSVK